MICEEVLENTHPLNASHVGSFRFHKHAARVPAPGTRLSLFSTQRALPSVFMCPSRPRHSAPGSNVTSSTVKHASGKGRQVTSGTVQRIRLTGYLCSLQRPGAFHGDTASLSACPQPQHTLIDGDLVSLTPDCPSSVSYLVSRGPVGPVYLPVLVFNLL